MIMPKHLKMMSKYPGVCSLRHTYLTGKEEQTRVIETPEGGGEIAERMHLLWLMLLMMEKRWLILWSTARLFYINSPQPNTHAHTDAAKDWPNWLRKSKHERSTPMDDDDDTKYVKKNEKQTTEKAECANEVKRERHTNAPATEIIFSVRRERARAFTWIFGCDKRHTHTHTLACTGSAELQNVHEMCAACALSYIH